MVQVNLLVHLRLLVYMVIKDKKVTMPKTSLSHLHLNTLSLRTVAKHSHRTQLQSNLQFKEKSALANGNTELMAELASQML